MSRIVNRGQGYLILLFFLAVIIITLWLPGFVRRLTGTPNVQDGGGLAFFTPTFRPTDVPLQASSPTANPTSPLKPSPVGASSSPTGCTFEVSFWRTNPESWPVEGITVGNLSLSKSEALALLAVENPPDVKVLLLQQVIAYTLNTFRGADPEPILPTVAQVRVWIDQHLNAGEVSEADRQQGAALAGLLSAFNAGLAGPGPCSAASDSPGPTSTRLGTATATPAPTPTPSPSLTPTETTLPPPIVLPTATETKRPRPRRTRPPTQPPTPTPTQPPPPTPTQPPPVPTSVPTPTQPPPPTPISPP